MSELKFPTEVVELPSKGLLYTPTSALASGKVEMKYMTAKEEDILSNQSYIQKGIVLDKLLQSLIVSPINYDELVIGDKNALMVASRILGYGADYTFTYSNKKYTIDLSQLENKLLDESLLDSNKEFAYTLPSTGAEITFKILSHADEVKINAELEGLKKINQENNPELSTRLKFIITSVNGNRDTKTIREFVDNYLLARDSRAFREHMRKVSPDVNLVFTTESGEEAALPIGLNFFWPDI
jgi:hypothetical protein